MRQLLATTAVKPDYSPDGRQILFTCFIRQQNKRICADGRRLPRRTADYPDPSIDENYPVWS
jgi:hypothetical protein